MNKIVNTEAAMIDIVERLRSENSMPPYYGPPKIQMDSAAEIERLRAALEPLACTCPAKHQTECSRSEVDCPLWNARAALAQEKPND